MKRTNDRQEAMLNTILAVSIGTLVVTTALFINLFLI
jgi:hypothetical protein